MHEKEVLQTFIQPLSGLPQWVPHFRFIQQSLLAFVPADNRPE